MRTLLRMGDIFDLIYVQRRGGCYGAIYSQYVGDSVDRMARLLRRSSLCVFFREAKRHRFGVTRVQLFTGTCNRVVRPYFPTVGFKKRPEKLVRASDHAEFQLDWHRVGNKKRLCYRNSAVVRTSTLTQQMVQIDRGAEYGNCGLSNTSF